MLFLLAAPLSHTVNEAVSDLSNPDVYNKDTGSSFSRAVEDTTGVKMSAIIYEEGGSLNESLAMMYDAQDQLTEAYKQAALPFVKAFAGDARAEQVSHQIDVLSERNREMTKPYVQQGKVGMEHSLDTLLHNLNAFTASLKAAMADPKTAYAEWKQSKTATEQPPAPAFLEVVSSADSAPAKAPEEKSAQANSNGAFFEHQWIPFMQTGVQSGAAFAAQGAATGSHFFSDPNFDLNKEGSEFQKTGVQTANAFGSLMQAKEDVPAARSADAISYNCMTRELWSKEKAAWCCEYKKLGCPETEAKAPAEKVGWMPFAQTGAETGASFAAQGANTAFRFFTDPNFDFQKEGEAYQASSAATADKFASIQFSENATVGDAASSAASFVAAKYAEHQAAEEAAKEEAAAPPAEKVGWMPFAQTGAETGVNFAAQGADTAFRFFTDPNFDFQKEGEAYQASGKATQDQFAAIDGAAAPGALRADAVAGDAHNSSFVAHVGIISFLAVNVAVFVAHRMNLRRKERAVIRQLDELV